MFFRSLTRKTAAWTLSILLIITLFPAASTKAASYGLAWQTSIVSVYTTASGGVWYPRLLKLSANEWLASFDTNAGGGHTRIVVTRTTDGGQTWSAPVTAVSHPDGDVGNGQMLRLPSGEIWLAYRQVIQSGSNYDISLRVRRSFDNGNTWSDLPGGVIESTSATSFKGVWEPHLEMIGNTIAVFYADDSPAAVGSTGLQNIYMKTWNGSAWVNRITVSDGVAAGSRDGMPVVAKMSNGQYIVVFEASDVPGHPFVIKYKISPDGFNWSGPRYTLYVPNKTGKKAGAPFVTKLPDGRLLASFQSDEGSPNTGDAYSSMYTMISSDNGATWQHKYNVFPVSNTTLSNWNALVVVDSAKVVAITSATYPQNGIFLRFGHIATPAQVNLVNNPGFETANIAGWTTYGNDFPERIHIHGTNDNVGLPAAEGNYFVGLSGILNGVNTAYIGQTITGLDNGMYTLRAKMRSSGGQNACYMEVKDYGGPMLTANCPVTTSWTQVTISNIPVTNGQATIGFYTSHSNTSQWADIDQVEFFLNSTGVTSGKIYRLMNPHSEKVLEVDAWGTANGSNVQIWTDHGGANQLWQIIDTGGGTVKLINVHSGKALDVDGMGTANGTNVQIWEDLNNAVQRWKLIQLN